MASRKLTREEKRLATLAEQTEKQKRSLVVQLRKTPVVQIACERTSVGRSTYYEWRAQDKIFARAADRALEHGRFFVNDLAESKLIALIQNGNLPAINLWLRHNHPKYATLNRVIHEHEVITERPSVEEEYAAMDLAVRAASTRLSGVAVKTNEGAIKKMVERYIANLNQRDLEIEQMRKYGEDPSASRPEG
jgi:hypothetical protein